MAQIARNLREGEARLPIEERLRLKLRRFIEATTLNTAGKLNLQIDTKQLPHLRYPREAEEIHHRKLAGDFAASRW